MPNAAGVIRLKLLLILCMVRGGWLPRSSTPSGISKGEGKIRSDLLHRVLSRAVGGRQEDSMYREMCGKGRGRVVHVRRDRWKIHGMRLALSWTSGCAAQSGWLRHHPMAWRPVDLDTGRPLTTQLEGTNKNCFCLGYDSTLSFSRLGALFDSRTDNMVGLPMH